MSDTSSNRSNDILAGVGGIVVAGSYQWHSSTFERLLPRPLLPVAGRALIDHVLDWFHNAGIAEATICANGSTGALRTHLHAAGTSSPALAFHEDHSPRGAAGCVKDAAAASTAQTLIVADGTSIPTVDVRALVEHHVTSGAALTIVVSRQGGAGMEASRLAPTGTYVFARSVLDAVPATSFQDIKESLIPRLHRDGARVELFEVDEVSPRVFDASSYLALNRWAVRRLADAAGAEAGGSQVIAHPSAWVDKDAVLVGPVLLGPGARVHSSAMIVGPAVIGAGTTVRSGALVSRSVVWDQCTIGERAVVDQCVLTHGAAVEAGDTVTMLLRAAAPKRRLELPRLLQKGAPRVGAQVRPAWS